VELKRNSALCYGCRSCELICSFHHLGHFRPGGGSISVRKDNCTGKILWHIDTTCDKCINEDYPLCVKYCTYGALSFNKSTKEKNLS